MNANIKAAVEETDSLSLKVNTGEKHRVSKPGAKGSLWLEVQREAYRLKLTGEVKSRLVFYVKSVVGEPSHEDQGDPVWHLPFDGSMERVVKELDRM